MAKATYVAVLAFFAILIQLMVGNIHIVIPLISFVIFYTTIVFGWKEGVICALFSGIVLDTLYGRTFLLSPLIGILIVLFAMLWLHKGELAILSFQMIPSAIISIIYIIPFYYYTYYQTEHGFILALENLGLISASVIISTTLLPMLIKFLDTLNIPLGFDLYRTSQKKIEKN